MDGRGTIRRTPNGSLDTDHYRRIAHRLRSATQRHWLQRLIHLGRRPAHTAPAPREQP